MVEMLLGLEYLPNSLKAEGFIQIHLGLLPLLQEIFHFLLAHCVATNAKITKLNYMV